MMEVARVDQSLNIMLCEQKKKNFVVLILGTKFEMTRGTEQNESDLKTSHWIVLGK